VGASWMKYALGEGLAKMAFRVTAKLVGMSGGSLGNAFLATFVIGVVQMIGGLIGTIVRRDALFPGWKLVFSSMWFGLFAFIMAVAVIYAFTYEGADVGITTFIVTLSIVPGAFIDWIFFKNPLKARQWLGIGAFLAAGYAILDFPAFEVLTKLPPWVWITFIIPFAVAINEGITRGISLSPVSSPFANNFWIGLTTIVLCAAGIFIMGTDDIAGQLEGLSTKFWLGATFGGLIILTMISFKLLAYKGGGTVALKKLIVMGTYLITAVIMGSLVYGESLTAGKIVGIFGFFVAFTFMDKGTWEVVSKRLAFLSKKA